MSELTYKFEGQFYRLNAEEREQFNNQNSFTCVQVGVITIFNLKSGNQVKGEVTKIDYIYPVDGFDVSLQAKFYIKTEAGQNLELRFHEIETHDILPFERKPLFK